MKLIKPYYQILTKIDGEEILKQIELAARTCYQSEGKIEYEDTHGFEINDALVGPEPIVLKDNYAKSARELIRKLIARGHEAMLEFGGNITVRFVCDRGVSYELVRHRIASFAQESTRYCNYGKDENITFIIPEWLSLPEGVYGYNGIDDLYGVKQNNTYVTVTDGRKKEDLSAHQFLYTIESCECSYNNLIKDGWSPQQARAVLPNALKTEINVSANIREWRHIFKLRTANAAHPQMRELMIPLLGEFKAKIPILFYDIPY